MDSTGAYGAGRSTGQFDVMAFVQKPQVIIRAFALLFSIIVFGCITSQGYLNEKDCIYGSQTACSFGIAIGVIAFLALIVFMCIDGLFANISSVQQRRRVVMADLGFSAFWTFMWFVCFCYLWSAWNSSAIREKALQVMSGSGVQAAIAFSFFSIPCFAGLTYFAYQSYKSGVNEDFSPAGTMGGNYDDFSRPAGTMGRPLGGGGGGGAPPTSAQSQPYQPTNNQFQGEY